MKRQETVRIDIDILAYVDNVTKTRADKPSKSKVINELLRIALPYETVAKQLMPQQPNKDENGKPEGYEQFCSLAVKRAKEQLTGEEQQFVDLYEERNRIGKFKPGY